MKLRYFVKQNMVTNNTKKNITHTFILKSQHIKLTNS